MEDLIFVLDHKLRTPGITEKKALKYLKNLSRLPVNLDVLKTTRIGKTVNSLAKNSSGETQSSAKQLLEKWRLLATREKVKPQKEHLVVKDNTKSTSGGGGELATKNDTNLNGHSQMPTASRKSVSLTSSSSFLNSMNKGLDSLSKRKRKDPHQSHAGGSKEEKSASTTPKSLQRSSGTPKPTLPDLQLPVLPNACLPDITPNYRPSYHYDDEDEPPSKKKASLSEANLASSIVSRKSRTQMFSGKRTQISGVVTSLYQQSMKILCENIDAIEDTGGVPFQIMEPLLAKCTPEQLLNLEDHNPYFTEDSGDLWKRHCGREFRGQTPDDMESWRELYLRLLEEREERLQKINEKISASQAAKVPIRQAKLAFASSSPKAPIRIRRRQEKNGTAPKKVLSRRPAQKNESSSSSAIRALAMSCDSAPPPVKKSGSRPTMMQAARRLFKAQRGRVNSSVMRR